MSSLMNVVLLSGDLMVQSRVEAAAVRAGSSLKSAPDSSSALALLQSMEADLLIIDLTASGLVIGEFVDKTRSEVEHTVRVIAFGPHVHEDRLNAARQAGCDEVISRGQFFAQLDALVVSRDST